MRNEESMKRVLVLLVTSFAGIGFASAQDANQAKFEKECAALLTKGGPCADVPKGEGRRRACVAKSENLEKASPSCKAVIAEWKATPKK
jgi:hypothetical protein